MADRKSILGPKAFDADRQQERLSDQDQVVVVHGATCRRLACFVM